MNCCHAFCNPADGVQDAVTSWEVEGAEASNSAQCGDLGFEVGQYVPHSLPTPSLCSLNN